VQNDEIDRLCRGLVERLHAEYPLTEEHSHAVAELCAQIAREMSLPDEQIVHVTRCGLVHDIGKAVIPKRILAAPRSLTPEEWSIVKAHSAVGEAILLSVPRLRSLAPVARSHHERLDGSGYPDGLEAAEIDLPTRIVAVADAFNAITGKRSYRPSGTACEAIEELRRGCGTQFDPFVVEAIARVVARGGSAGATARG
jgi:HD-GYP domain-containing protein (c-di-GMP phosphodiesterase class II)